MTEEIIENLKGTLSEEATERILNRAVAWESVVSIVWASVTFGIVCVLADVAIKVL